MKNEAGFSVIEVMLAAGLFVIFAAGMATVVLQGLDANRAAGEQIIASQFASEGLEAARSIKNQSFANLIDSAGTGATISNGVWDFSGSNNVFDKYTRVLAISDVLRDSSGNIVASGGTLDPNTKKISSTVSWEISAGRNNNVILTTYLANWRAATVPPTCAQYCVSLSGYTAGTCRQNQSQCKKYNETYESGGSQYCPGFPTKDSCCCL